MDDDNDTENIGLPYDVDDAVDDDKKVVKLDTVRDPEATAIACPLEEKSSGNRRNKFYF